MQKITPMLWFDIQAEEAARFYVSVFPNSRILQVTHYGDHGPMPKGLVMTVSFELAGQRFTARRMLQEYATQFYMPAMCGRAIPDEPPVS